MAVNQQPDQTAPSDEARTQESVRNLAQMQSLAEPAKEAGDRSIDQASHAADLVRDGLGRASEMQNRTRESVQRVMMMGLEALGSSAREINEHVSRTFGFGHEDGERLSEQWRQNTEAVTRCGTVMGHAVHDAWRGSLELGQKRWQRGFENLNRLAQTRSMQEFTLVQSEIARESLHGMVVDTRTIAERSLRAFEEAGRICSSAQPPTLVR